MSIAHDFLVKHHMEPERIVPSQLAGTMADSMRRGLKGLPDSLPMIPTYLSNDGAVPVGSCAIVIDAGGTNFRSGLGRFTEKGFELEQLQRCKMPGTESPCTWQEFISFTADRIEPLLSRTDRIGFCFSYNAEITPDMDGRVSYIDKEVAILGCEGQLVAASLNNELEKRGFGRKKVVVLNDTVAALLGGTVGIDKGGYSGFIGQISGTGTNTCTAVPRYMVEKLGLSGEQSMLINLESGTYSGIKGSDFDLLLDEQSSNPNLKLFEKKTAGVYLGELCRLMLLEAYKEGLLSAASYDKIMALGHISSADIDPWSYGEGLEQICSTQTDREFVQEICLSMFQRSARCMAVNLLAIGLLTVAGHDKPICICAEGSLVQYSHCYRPALEALLKAEGEKLGMHFQLMLGQDTTLSGSAVAALLN